MSHGARSSLIWLDWLARDPRDLLVSIPFNPWDHRCTPPCPACLLSFLSFFKNMDSEDQRPILTLTWKRPHPQSHLPSSLPTWCILSEPRIPVETPSLPSILTAVLNSLKTRPVLRLNIACLPDVELPSFCCYKQGCSEQAVTWTRDLSVDDMLQNAVNGL